MARFTTQGIDRLEKTFADLSLLPDDIIERMLLAQADRIEPAQKRKMRVRWTGRYATGKTADSLTRTSPKRGKSGISLYLTFRGSHHGTRNGEIAFINEYGKTNQPARPAIREANEENADQAVEDAADVLDRWIQKHV